MITPTVIDLSQLDLGSILTELVGQTIASGAGALIGGALAAVIAWRVFVSERNASAKDRETERKAAAADRDEEQERRSRERAAERELDAQDREAERAHARAMRAEEQSVARQDRYNERVHAAAEPVLDTLSGMLVINASDPDSLKMLMRLQARAVILKAMLRGADKPVGTWLELEVLEGTQLLAAAAAVENSTSDAALEAADDAHRWAAVLSAHVTNWLRGRPDLPPIVEARHDELESRHWPEGEPVS